MINKKQVGVIHAYDYKLIDNAGKVYKIIYPGEDSLLVQNDNSEKETIGFNKIGIDFFLLVRPLKQMAQEIEYDLVKFVPIELLRDIELNAAWRLSEYNGVAEYNQYEKGFNCWANYIGNLAGSCFGYDSSGYFYHLDKYGNHLLVKKQKELHEKLYEWNFNIGFPEGLIRYIK